VRALDVSQLFGRPLRIDDCVVVVPVFGAGPTWADCAQSLLEHTSAGTPIALFDDAGPFDDFAEIVRAAEASFPGREFFYFRQSVNLGFVENVNTAFEMLAPADVIVLNSDTIVGPEWDERLIAAGRSMSTIATATALTNNGTIYSVPSLDDWNSAPPSRSEVRIAANRVAARSESLRPHMPAATSFCTFYSRRALNVAGHFDPTFSPGYGEEIDFCIRAQNLGFVHVAADDVLVYHAGGETFGKTEVNETKQKNDLLVAQRHSHWIQRVNDFVGAVDSPRERAIHLAGCAVKGLTVLIDAENIHPELTGTFEGSIQLAKALDAHEDILQVIWTATAARQEDIRLVLSELDFTKTRFAATESLDNLPNVDIAFRPCQDFAGVTWPKLTEFARRNIIWILDLIATHIPDYSLSYSAHARLRDSMEASIERADGVAVLTPHVKRDLESFTAHRVADKVFQLPNGLPAISEATLSRSSTPGELDRSFEIDSILQTEFVLVLGTNFWHKNHTWFLRVIMQVSNIGWEGRIVFAGPRSPLASSEMRDRELAQLWDSGRVTFLDRVTDQERLRLLSGARLVVAPSISEGWGMIPLEALAMGSVPLSSRGGGLLDITPADAKYLTLVDDQLDALTVHSLLVDERKRAAQVMAWIGADFPTWSQAADILVDHMYVAISRPRAFEAKHMQRIDLLKVELKRRLRVIVNMTSPTGTKRRKCITFVANLLRRIRRITST
jgi:GT2 family glycosyltransferase